MNTCDTCKWWTLSDGDRREKDTVLFGRCLHPKIAYDEDAWVKSKDGATQWGMDAGYVMFATGPKFGCVLHKSECSEIRIPNLNNRIEHAPFTRPPVIDGGIAYPMKVALNDDQEVEWSYVMLNGEKFINGYTVKMKK